MKIILVNNLYGKYARGGAETITKVMAELLESQGYEVRIITTKPKFNCIHDDEKNIYYISSWYYYLDRAPLFLRFFYHTIELASIFKLIRFILIFKRESPDLVITHNMKGLGTMSILSLKMLGLKHIHYLHDIQLLHPSGLMMPGDEKKIDSWLASVFQFVNRIYFRKVDAVIAPSAWLKGLYTTRGFFRKAHREVIFNPINGSGEIFFREDEPDKSAKTKFLFVGQIEEHKGMFQMIKAFSALPASQSWSLDIIGPGSQIETLTKIVKDKNLNNISVHGPLENTKVLQFMSESDCLVVPSVCYENSPTVLYEAARVGLPALASCFGGIKELADYFGFRTFDPLNHDDFKINLEWILKNREVTKKSGMRSASKLKMIDKNNYFVRLKNIFDILRV